MVVISGVARGGWITQSWREPYPFGAIPGRGGKCLGFVRQHKFQDFLHNWRFRNFLLLPSQL